MEDARTDLSGLIAKLNRQINDGVRYDRVLDVLFDELGTIVPNDRLGIAILSDGDQTVSLRWMRSKLGQTHLPLGFTTPLRSSSLQNVMASLKPRIIGDLERYLEEHPTSSLTRAALADGVRSSLTFPLKAEGRPVGFVFFSSGRPNTYSSYHSDLLSEMAEELSLLVQYGKLHQFFESNRNNERLLRIALHDLRAPLATIQGFVQLAQSEPWYDGLDPESQDIFRRLLKNTDYMFELIADLATSGELTRGSRLEATRVELRPFLADAVAGARLAAQKKGIALEAQLADDLPEAGTFAAAAVRQVLDNLLTNAVKFSRAGTTIRMSVTARPDRLEFAVSDQGVGIPEPELPLLFTEFGRTSARPTAGEPSTGLGLYIARRIVERHGGQITVESRAGVGTTFRFWLPR